MAALITKILTVGSTLGSIRDLFTKVSAIDKKHGKFDLLLCVGDFFGPPTDDPGTSDDEIGQLLSGLLEAPIECYIMQGEYPLPPRVIEKFAKTGGELCKNVFLMSKSGIVTTANRIRIACLGGIFEPQIFSTAEAAPGFMSPFFSHHTIDRLLSNTLTSSTNQQTQNKKSTYASLASIQASASSSQSIDILLTNAWPVCITQLCQSYLADPQPNLRAPPLDEVIRKIKPRYHFAAGVGKSQPPMFWEREPYVWDDEKGRVSRFVSLGAFGGETVAGKKQRWFYAFSISPNNPGEAHPRPPNATKNPFTENYPRTYKRPMHTEGENFIFGNVQHPQKRSRVEQAEPGKPPPGYKCRRCESSEHFINDCPERLKPPESYICKICHEPGHFVRDCPTRSEVGDTGGKKPKPGYVCRACGSENHYLEDCLVANQPHGEHRSKRGPPKEIAPDECWFCLSNPNLAKHLIVAIGSECYVTLPKGQIIPTQSAANYVNVPGGGHVLIVPITHYPTYSTIPSDLAPSIVEETEQYKKALRSMYAKYNCLPVVFEVGRLSAKGGHAHVQVVPVPQQFNDNLEDSFVKEGRLQGIEFEEDPEVALSISADGNGSYFRVDLPDGKKLVHLMKENVPFSVQFGRMVLANLMGMPQRYDWKACVLSVEEDRADAEEFKKSFASFDPMA